MQAKALSRSMVWGSLSFSVALLSACSLGSGTDVLSESRVQSPLRAADTAPLTMDTCPTTFSFRPSGPVANVRVAGEWQGFDLTTAPAMSRDGAGTYTVTVPLPVGLQAYKFVYDAGGTTNWVLDAAQGRRKYVGGFENSAVKVADCRLPTFVVTSSQPARPGPGRGTYLATLSFRDGSEGSGLSAAGYVATLEQDGSKTPLTGAQLTVSPTGDATILLSNLADGKYRVVIRGKTNSGRLGEPLRLVFWIESESFSWQDALVYRIGTDRFRDGDKTNNPGPTPHADPRADWQGGDLDGVRQAISDGTFDVSVHAAASKPGAI